VPETCEYTSELAMLDEKERIDIATKVGIECRRIAAPGICASDLCVAAAKQLLQQENIPASSIGILVFVTQTPDYILPGNSMLAQQWLGLSSSTLLLDLNQGCAGYVYGLSVIASMMQVSGIEYGLLLVGDTITRLVSPYDRTTKPIFSDAGTATLLQRTETVKPIYFNIGADSKGFTTIQVKGGGARYPFLQESLVLKEEMPGVKRSAIHLAMEGLDVLNYSLVNVVPNIKGLLEYADCNLSDVDYFVFHQANRILNNSILKRIGIPPEKAPETLSVFGNTSSATIPLTVSYRLGALLSKEPKRIMLSGFGVGFSWGSALLQMEALYSIPLIEISSPDG
jgi:3-oxoacyl-[acyl-carrier-protein] synthase III